MAWASALISAGMAAAGAIGSAVKNSKARKEENRAYQDAKAYLNSEYYRDPLTTVGNRALLKSLDERMKDNVEAINNRAAAGGATMENLLAARKSNNEVMSGVYSRLLQGEEGRRQAVDAQRMRLDMQHSGALQGSYLQDAQNWQSWGAAASNAAMQYGNAQLLDVPQA